MSVQLPGGEVGSKSAHFPAVFPDAPALVEGTYMFEWFGFVRNEPNELLLASGRFRVNSHLQVSCA